MNDVEFGEEVRRQGRPEEAGRSMKDLVYNPATGEFEQVARTEDPSNRGIVVTEMTEGGFAA
ncbi:MAG: hypothetical protein K2L84_05565 [Muribaculaceae bacterium]|nr:hypothetical protein [Muribaculaceae bacterium]